MKTPTLFYLRSFFSEHYSPKQNIINARRTWWFNRLTLPRLKSMGFLFHRPQHSELRLTRSLGELLLQLFSTGLKFRMPYGIVSISGYWQAFIFRLLTSLYTLSVPFLNNVFKKNIRLSYWYIRILLQLMKFATFYFAILLLISLRALIHTVKNVVFEPT